MSRVAARFTQADVARALRAAKQVGDTWFVEITPDGAIRIVPAVSAKLSSEPETPAAPERKWRI